MSYTYDTLNRLTRLTEPAGAVTTFGYDAAWRRTSTNYPNGVTQTIAYDAPGRQTRVIGKGPAGDAGPDRRQHGTAAVEAAHPDDMQDVDAITRPTFEGGAGFDS